MNKVRKQFILYAMIAIFVLLGVLLTIINGVNFTMASEDADQITQMLSGNRGSFAPAGMAPQEFSQPPGRMGPMGPSSPEMRASVRYFTFRFDENGNADKVAFAISAVSEEDAAQWAKSLLSRQDTGWSRGTYRYRIYRAEGQTYVTVIDQGRELLSSYRILAISLVGLAAGLLISFAALTAISKRLFRPLEEADRKQKKFLADVEKAFKVPLTVISANTETWERRSGTCDETQSINRQVRRMTALVRDLGSLGVFEKEDLLLRQVDLGALCCAVCDDMAPQFAQKNLTLQTEIAPDIAVQGDAEALQRLVREWLENALKFALSRVTFTLRRQGERVEMLCANDTDLPKGSADQVFDRFTRLENARGKQGAGLGLAGVKEIAKIHNARLSAKVSEGIFTVSMSL